MRIRQGRIIEIWLLFARSIFWSCLPSLAIIASASSSSAQSGRTVIDVSYVYSHARLQPTYDANIRGQRSYRLTLSGHNTVTVHQHHTSGKYRADWTDNFRAGSNVNSWRFSGPHRLTKVTNWPHSTTTTTIEIGEAGNCRVSVVDTLKPGFKEFKFPMMSRHEFGIYTRPLVSQLTCAIRNED